MSARQNLFTIAPHVPFLPLLVDRILDGTLLGDWPRTGPFWLADITIVLPTRRARLALANAFLARGHGLLPDIRTFGGDAGEEEPFLPPLDAPTPLQPMARLERKLILAQLIAAWAKAPAGLEIMASPPNAAEILALSDSLSDLVDDMEVENVSANALKGLAQERDLAANWQQTLKFLAIALAYWPQELAERGKADATTLRNERLERQAAAAPLIFGDRPVIAAGSTGSVPATGRLLQALAGLPRGVVVLPGLDTNLDAQEHAILLDPTQAPHSHPQFGLAQLVRRFGSTIAAVTELAPSPSMRTHLVRRALALPAGTAHWQADKAAIASDALSKAIAGIEIVAARNQTEEARAIALAARARLARGQTVGIVTPDRNLARRIAVELARFDIFVDDAAGAPLFHAPAGRLVRLALAVAVDEFAPVDLMALLRNRATRLGLERAEVARLADKIELAMLRGQRVAPGLAGLRANLAANLEGEDEGRAPRLASHEGAAIDDLLTRLDRAITPICTILREASFSATRLAQALGTSFAALVEGAPEAGTLVIPGRAELEKWVADLAGRTAEGPPLNAIAIEGVLFGLMNGLTVRNPQPRRDDIAIWGQIEARLQNPDLLIMAALNEDIWPEAADPGPWLSRGMRLAAGLEPPERKHGLAAHDFEMGMGNQNVLLAFADRLGTAPALPSRLVQRLEAFLGTEATRLLRARGAVWCLQARQIDAAGLPNPAPRPLPRPAAALRPRRLTVTDVETLFRSPYDLYARYVLGLRRIDPLGEEAGARERGSMIHEVFARFVNEGCDFFAPDALETLDAMAVQAFEGLGAIADRRDIWLRRFSVAAEAFLAFERERHARVAQRHAEIKGDWLFPALENFRLVGRADRVDILHDGTVEIIDFKTGSLPSAGDMRNFDAPQLPLEAAMARVGALEGVPPALASALTYIKIGLGPEAFAPTGFKTDQSFMAAADEVTRRLQGHVEALLLREDRPMAARIRPDLTLRYRGTYDHLMRADEWTLLDGDTST